MDSASHHGSVAEEEMDIIDSLGSVKSYAQISLQSGGERS